MIEANHIELCYGSKKVLQDINLRVGPGEIVVLIGPSGSGKSSILNSLGMLANPTSGTLRYDEKKFNFPSDREQLEHFQRQGNSQTLGFVFQDLHLIPHWTNYQNIVYPLGKKLNEHQKRLLDELIGLFGLESFIGRFPNESSKGEEQRIALCRAIMLNPKYLFLDEITAALDPEQIATVLKYCITLKKQGKGLLIVTHYIPFAMKAADKVIFIDKGRVVESGDSKILKAPKSERLKSYLESLQNILYQ